MILQGQPYVPFSWKRRFTYGTFAILSTVAYGASFYIHPENQRFLTLFSGVSLASPAAWGTLGLFVLFSGGLKKIWAWGDLCLSVMVLGNAILNGGLLLNLFGAHGSTNAWAQASFVLAADLAMAVKITRDAHWVGLSRKAALALWVLGMNGVFLTVLWLWLR